MTPGFKPFIVSSDYSYDKEVITVCIIHMENEYVRTSSPVNSVILECKVRETDVMISYKAITVDCFLVITLVSNFLTMKHLGLQLM